MSLVAAGSLTTGAARAAIAYTTGSSLDVADGKPTFGDVAFGAPASRGNDGSIAAGNWTHADYPASGTPYPGQAGNAPNPYWEVDLLATYTLTHIVVTDRVDCCSPNRLNGATVTLFGAGGSVIGTAGISGIADGTYGSVFTFNNGGSGFSGVQRVRIDGVSQYFQFAEFDAFATSHPVNWALGTAVQFYSASGIALSSYPGFPSSNVTDGDFNTFTHPDSPPHADSYAEIDLAQSIYVDSLTLAGRLDGCCPDRLFDYQIQFLDGAGTLIHTMSHTGGTMAAEKIDVIASYGGLGPHARFVRVVNTNDADYGPQIGELQVFGVIPEPSSVLLAALGCGAFLRRRR